MKIFIFFLTFLFSLSVFADNVGDTDEYKNLDLYYYDYNRYSHYFYHHQFDTIFLSRETAKLFEDMFQTIDDRIDLLDDLAKNMYAASCAIPNRNEQACTKLAESFRAITNYDDRHQEIFCTVDMLHEGEAIVHDLNLPVMHQRVFLAAIEICEKFPGQTGIFYRTLISDFSTFLKSGHIEKEKRKGNSPSTDMARDFLLFRANFRPPVSITPTYGPLLD